MIVKSLSSQPSSVFMAIVPSVQLFFTTKEGKREQYHDVSGVLLDLTHRPLYHESIKPEKLISYQLLTQGRYKRCL